MPKLTVNENSQGFTDEITISFEDFSVANAGTLADRATKTFTYAIPAGSLVTKASAKLVTAFNDSGSGDDLTITVGDAAADTIDILFSPDTDNDAPYSLNELTAGEIKLKFEICDLN